MAFIFDRLIEERGFSVADISRMTDISRSTIDRSDPYGYSAKVTVAGKLK